MSSNNNICRSNRLCHAILLASAMGCTDPHDVIFGADPTKQVTEHPEILSNLAEDERRLIAAYIAANELKKLTGSQNAITGLSVSDVIKDAKQWKADEEKQEADRVKSQQEAKALADSVKLEQQKSVDAILKALNVAIISKKQINKDYKAGRFYEGLMLRLVFENKGNKTIKQFKGYFEFIDYLKQPIGSLDIDVNQTIKPNEIVKENTDFFWNAEIGQEDKIKAIAQLPNDGMIYRFIPLAIAYDDGEIIQVPSTQ